MISNMKKIFYTFILWIFSTIFIFGWKSFAIEFNYESWICVSDDDLRWAWPCIMNGSDIPTSAEEMANRTPSIWWRFMLFSKYGRTKEEKVRKGFKIGNKTIKMPAWIKHFPWMEDIFVSLMSFKNWEIFFNARSIAWYDSGKSVPVMNMELLQLSNTPNESTLLTAKEKEYLPLLIDAKFLSVNSDKCFTGGEQLFGSTAYCTIGEGQSSNFWWFDKWGDIAYSYPITAYKNAGAEVVWEPPYESLDMPFIGMSISKWWDIWNDVYSSECDEKNCKKYTQHNFLLYKTWGIIPSKTFMYNKYDINNDFSLFWSEPNINMYYLLWATMFTTGEKSKLMGTMLHGTKKMKCVMAKTKPTMFYAFTTLAWEGVCNNQDIIKSLNGYSFNNEYGNFFANKYDIMDNFAKDLWFYTTDITKWPTSPNGKVVWTWGSLWSSVNTTSKYHDFDDWCKKDQGVKVCRKLVKSIFTLTHENKELYEKYKPLPFKTLAGNFWYKNDFPERTQAIVFQGVNEAGWYFLWDSTFVGLKDKKGRKPAYYDVTSLWSQDTLGLKDYAMDNLASPFNNLPAIEVFQAMYKYIYYWKKLGEVNLNWFWMFSGKIKNWSLFHESDNVSRCQIKWTRVECILDKNSKSKDLILVNAKKDANISLNLYITKKDWTQIKDTRVTTIQWNPNLVLVQITSDARQKSMMRLSKWYGIQFYRNSESDVFSELYNSIKLAWNLPKDVKDINYFKQNYSITAEYKEKNQSDRLIIQWGDWPTGWGGIWNTQLELFWLLAALWHPEKNYYSFADKNYLNGSKNDFKMPAKVYVGADYNDILPIPIMFLSRFRTGETKYVFANTTVPVVFKNTTTGQNFAVPFQFGGFGLEAQKVSAMWIKQWEYLPMGNAYVHLSKNSSWLTFSNIFGTWWGVPVKVSNGDKVEITMNGNVVYKFIYWKDWFDENEPDPPSLDDIEPSILFTSPSTVYWYVRWLKDIERDDYYGIMDAVDYGDIDFDKYPPSRFLPLVTVRVDWGVGWFGKAMQEEYWCADNGDTAECTIEQLSKWFWDRYWMTPYARFCIGDPNDFVCEDKKPLSSVMWNWGWTLSDDELEWLSWYYFGSMIWPEAKKLQRVNGNFDRLLEKMPKWYNYRQLAMWVEFFVEWWGYDGDDGEGVLRSEEFYGEGSSWVLARWFLKPICQVSFVWPKYTNAEKPYSVLQWTMPEGWIKRWYFYVNDYKNRRISSDRQKLETGGTFQVKSDQLFVPKDITGEIIYPLTVNATFYFDREQCRNSSQKLIPDVIICPSDFKVNTVNVEKGTKPNEYILHIYTSITGDVCWPWLIKKVDIFRPLLDDWQEIYEKEEETNADGENVITVKKWKIKSEDKLKVLKKEWDIPSQHLINTKNLLQSIENPIGVLSPDKCDYNTNGKFTCKVELNYDTVNFINHNIDLINTQLNLPVNVEVQWMKRIFD